MRRVSLIYTQEYQCSLCKNSFRYVYNFWLIKKNWFAVENCRMLRHNDGQPHTLTDNVHPRYYKKNTQSLAWIAHLRCMTSSISLTILITLIKAILILLTINTWLIMIIIKLICYNSYWKKQTTLWIIYYLTITSWFKNSCDAIFNTFESINQISIKFSASLNFIHII